MWPASKRPTPNRLRLLHQRLPRKPDMIASAVASTRPNRVAWLWVVGVPAMLLLICLADKLGTLPLGQGLRTLMIFALLVSLMLSGMPISIALGLTVLTFLFTLTSVPIESVALKLFTGIEKF